MTSIDWNGGGAGSPHCAQAFAGHHSLVTPVDWKPRGRQSIGRAIESSLKVPPFFILNRKNYQLLGSSLFQSPFKTDGIGFIPFRLFFLHQPFDAQRLNPQGV
ncbi:MAG: hypothetical protein ACO3B3_02940 [Cyanobium sp.]